MHKYAYKGVTASSALEFYSERRTSNRKGVTIPSQIRFVNYFEYYVKNKNINLSTKLLLKYIKMYTVPEYEKDDIAYITSFEFGGGSTLCFTVKANGKEWVSKEKSEPVKHKGDKEVIFFVNLEVSQEVKIEFFHKQLVFEESVFYVWFHTAFIKSNVSNDIQLVSLLW